MSIFKYKKDRTDSPGDIPGERRLNGKWTVTAGVAALLLWSVFLCSVTFYLTAEASAGTGLYSTAELAIWHMKAVLKLYLFSFNALLLNLLPVMIVTALAFFITNRAWLAALLSFGVSFALAVVNYYKLLLRDDPLMAADVMYVSEAVGITTGEGYDLVVTRTMLGIAGAAVVIIILFAIFIKLRFKPKRYLLRAGLSAASIALFVVLVMTVYSSEDIYNDMSCITAETGYLNVWSDSDQYVSRGVVYSFLHSTADARPKKPAGYSSRAAEKALYDKNGADIPDGSRVSVIAIMLEAFNDFSKFDRVEFKIDPYENFHRLGEESVTGTLVTNIFAGGTYMTERAFITGFSELYDFRSATPSIASYFYDQGYNTVSEHPGYGWFYNRQNVNRHLGFEENYFSENRYSDSKYLYNDDKFFSDIISLFEDNKKTGQPLFSFAVTYQNHGPYESDAFSGDEIAAQNGISDESHVILNNYLNGIKRTDEAIGMLTDHFRTEDEPVVIILFGDHNPWLGNNASVYEELGINIDRSTDEGFYNYYETPYMIWANDAAKTAVGNDFTRDGGSFSPMFLSEKLFELCSWEGDGFMCALRELREAGIDIIHDVGVFRENGELTSDLSESGESALSEFYRLQYYRLTEG